MSLSFTKLGCGLLFSSALSYASALSIYQDSTIYTFTPEGGYLGFTQGIEASCQGKEFSLLIKEECPLDDRLCKEHDLIEKTKYDLVSVTQKLKTLEHFVALSKLTQIDPKAWIEGSKMIGEESASMMIEQDKLKNRLSIKEDEFAKQAPSQNPLYLAQTCPESIKLTFPYGQIRFSSYYEAGIIDENQIEVTQYLSIRNASGLDIKADEAMLYYRSARRTVNPIHFSPWIARKYSPQPRMEYKSAMPVARSTAQIASDEMIAAPAPMEVSYEDAREYKIKNLTLSSSGEAVEVPVISWKIPVKCEIVVYPYADMIPYRVCKFEPKYQIDTNRWKIKAGDEIINKQAIGEYEEGIYNLYTQIEEDLQLKRKPIVQNEANTGFFGNTVRKKDGFVLEVMNKSDKPKSLTITERIPTSTSEEIKVKLLSVTQGILYKELKDGKIEMKLDLKAHENKTIEVLFELSYDKELKVVY
ncbi:MAG: DUF4139 domain-containing protein [Campylobacterales bacterium]|nr:DUF4139 domain-containing protein [Campylobacterales bacterium]